MTAVQLYSKPSGCGKCVAAKSYLRKNGIAFVTHDATENVDFLKSHGILEAPGIFYEPLGIVASGFDINALERIKDHFEADHPHEGELS